VKKSFVFQIANGGDFGKLVVNRFLSETTMLRDEELTYLDSRYPASFQVIECET
jgi:hypothetical protein